jgi:hypothetical protein
MKWCDHEPTLEEILSDPIFRAMMDADGVDPQKLETMLREVAAFSRSDRNAAQQRSAFFP